MMRYLPGGCSRQVSMMAWSTPQAFPMSRVICWASSAGLTCWTPRISWLLLSVGCFLETYLKGETLSHQHPKAKEHHLPKLDEGRTRQVWAYCPLCNLEAVILQLCGQHSSSLGVQLLSPIHTTRELYGYVNYHITIGISYIKLLVKLSPPLSPIRWEPWCWWRPFPAG